MELERVHKVGQDRKEAKDSEESQSANPVEITYAEPTVEEQGWFLVKFINRPMKDDRENQSTRRIGQYRIVLHSESLQIKSQNFKRVDQVWTYYEEKQKHDFKQIDTIISSYLKKKMASQ